MKCYAQYKGSVGVEAHGAFSYGRIKSHKKRGNKTGGIREFYDGLFSRKDLKKSTFWSIMVYW